MEANTEKGGRNYWRHVDLTWTLNSDVRQWLRGGGKAIFARKAGFALSMLSAAVMATMGGILFIETDGCALVITYLLIDYLFLAEALLYLVLGCLLYRGVNWAAFALMGLCTIDKISAYLITIDTMAYRQHAVAWLTFFLLGWLTYMRFFYVALRVGQRRTGGSAEGVLPDDKPIPIIVTP